MLGRARRPCRRCCSRQAPRRSHHAPRRRLRKFRGQRGGRAIDALPAFRPHYQWLAPLSQTPDNSPTVSTMCNAVRPVPNGQSPLDRSGFRQVGPQNAVIAGAAKRLSKQTEATKQSRLSPYKDRHHRACRGDPRLAFFRVCKCLREPHDIGAFARRGGHHPCFSRWATPQGIGCQRGHRRHCLTRAALFHSSTTVESHNGYRRKRLFL